MLTRDDIKNIIEEINGTEERDRRALAKRRHDIYRDGGRAFLVEQIKREFGQEALTEMRLAPLNLLKKIINKRASVYKKPPVRLCAEKTDQALVDYYTRELGMNTLMQKVNRYNALFANTVIYTRPVNGEIECLCVPSYLYSIVPNKNDRTKVDAFVFNDFKEEGLIAPQQAPMSSTGNGSFSLERGFASKSTDKVDSNEINTDTNRNYIFWDADTQITANESGDPILLDPELGPEQFSNPIAPIIPVVNVAKDRDNESWAQQGEDMIDLTLALQMGWTDLLTIAKHQGFSLMTIVSEEEPSKLTVGINRAVWLKARQDSPTPSIDYVSSNSPLAEYKEMLMDLLGLLLTTNDMDPGSIGGKNSTRNFTSGFHAMIAMADNLEAVESDKPIMAEAEHEQWEVIAAWHNYLFDTNQLADEECKSLGKFSPDFEVQIIFSDAQPIESEKERLDNVKELRDMGLITREDALRRLHPELTSDQIKEKLALIDAELGRVKAEMTNLPETLPPDASQPEEPMNPQEHAQHMAEMNGANG